MDAQYWVTTKLTQSRTSSSVLCTYLLWVCWVFASSCVHNSNNKKSWCGMYNWQVQVLILKCLVQAPLRRPNFLGHPYTYNKKCDTICIHLAHGIFVENHNFLKTMKSHCAFRIIIVDNLGKIWNCWEWNGFQSWFEILMKSKTNRLVENNVIWRELRPSDVLDNAEPAFHPFSSPLV